MENGKHNHLRGGGGGPTPNGEYHKLFQFFGFPFPNFLFADAQKENLLVKGQLEVKQFCIDYVQRAEVKILIILHLLFHFHSI